MQQLINSPRYTIQALINRGAFGEVYDAFDNVTLQPVAVKVEKVDKDS